MKHDRLTWTVMLGLVTSAAAVSSCWLFEDTSAPSYPAGHPCYQKGNCTIYLRLPDGGASELPDSGAIPAGATTPMCGPCNG